MTDEKPLTRFYKELSKIRAIEKCRNCICFYETLKYFDDETSRLGGNKPDEAYESDKWWIEKEEMEIHDCLGCDPCLPVEAYSEFCKSLGKKAYCPVCGGEME